MSAMSSCLSCQGFIPGPGSCPNCGAEQAPASGLRPLVRSVLALAGAGVAAITLMACYGSPPCDHNATDGGPDDNGGSCWDDYEPFPDAGTADGGQ
jgi:hypothetical protein